MNKRKTYIVVSMRKNLTTEVNSFKLLIIMFPYCPYFGVHIDGIPDCNACTVAMKSLN